MRKGRPVLLLAGPHLEAISGVSTHLNALLRSRRLAGRFELVHFQVGSEGRRESRAARIARLAWSPWQLAIAILRHGATVLHLNTSLNAGAYWRDLAYLLVGKLCGVRVVYQVHGGALPQAFFRGAPLPTALLRASLRLPDAVVVLANAELEAYRRFAPHPRLMRIANGVACGPARAPADRAATRTPLTFLYLGRLAREKGLYEALDALRLARVRGLDARLVVAGEGPEAGPLRRHVRELGLAQAVSFAGPVFGADKEALLAGADVFLLPSHGEGLPYALLEAMAAGMPVIATRVGAIADVVADGTHGILVPVRDAPAIAAAMRQLASDGTREQMAVAAAARIRAAYSIERVVDDFDRLYGALCSPPRAGGDLLRRS